MAGTITLIGDATTPLAMFIVGFQLGGIRLRELVGEASIYGVTLIRLFIAPALALLIAWLMPGEMTLLHKATVLSLAMPCASCSVMFSQQCDGETEYMTKGVMITTLLSLATIPLITVLVEMV